MKRLIPVLILACAPFAAQAAVLGCVPAVAAPEMRHATEKAVLCAQTRASDYLQRVRQPEPTAATLPEVEAYVPKTAHDNTPWRFDMNQNGRRMTADEFAAWMKAKGIRVATGRPATQGTAAANPVTPAPDTLPSPPPEED